LILKRNNNKAYLSNHLIELRNRVIYFFLFFIFSFFFSYLFVEDIFSFVTKPIIESISYKENNRLIYTGLAEAFFSYLKLSLITALIISSPFLIYQIWAFVAPGLLNKEKKIIFPFIFLVPIMFISGFIFLYYFVIPIAWDFFTAFDTSGSEKNFRLELEPKINEYISLTVKLAFAFGLAFQLPTAIFLLTILGITSPRDLEKKRRYVIVIIFLVSALITPPDIISQIGLAIPIILIYEISIFISKFFEKKKK
tara:strand:+ start:2310 stop:3068 length:759 start_codon:yes stop_codon:yes gene_type:complete